jgi:CspA family cold shock protein
MESVSNVSSSERLSGRVKWFNNKAGYGFITVTEGIKSGTDVFVHHSSINVNTEQYRYLVEGEYVEFGLTEVDNKCQVNNVSGIGNGKLMCETRHEAQVARSNHGLTKNGPTDVTEPVKLSRSVSVFNGKHLTKHKVPEMLTNESIDVKSQPKSRGRPAKTSVKV